MPFIKAQPNEYLVTGQKGRVVNRGAAVSLFLWPGTSYVLISGTEQEATFEMTQESRDGIPLRFKGMVVYRVVRPEETARRFDFSQPDGHTQIQSVLSHVCLGELRAQVSHLSMQECIEQRKTTLTDSVAAALGGAVNGWGVEIDVVQVAQVFIVDQELRRQLEADVRNQIRASSELSDLRASDELSLATSGSQRKELTESLLTERETARIEQERSQLKLAVQQEETRVQAEISGEKLRQRMRLEREAHDLEHAAELRRLELAHELETRQAPLRLEKLKQENELLERQVELLRRQVEVRELEVRLEMLRERAQHELRKEMLPLEQVPQVADSVSRMFQGAQLTFYGEASPLLSALTPVLKLLRQ